MKADEIIKEFERQIQNGHRLREKVDNKVDFNDLPKQKMIALIDLMMFGRSKLKDMSKKVFESPQYLCMIYNGLEKDGYVKREIDENDRRNVYYSITEKGLTILNKRKAEIEETILGMLSKIKEDDLQKFGEALKTINKIMEEYF